MTAMKKYRLREDPARQRYEFDLDAENGVKAYIDYELDGDTITLTHTIVPPAFEGQGIGAQLVAAVLAEIRRKGLRVVPQCSFVALYIERHPVWHDMIRREHAGVESES